MIPMPYSTSSKIHRGGKKSSVLCVLCDSVVRLITSDPLVCRREHETRWFLLLKQNAVVP